MQLNIFSFLEGVGKFKKASKRKTDISEFFPLKTLKFPFLSRLSRPSLNLNLPKFARAAAPRPQSLASLKERQTSLAAGKLALAIDKT